MAAKDSLGPQWGYKNVEDVPVSVLSKMEGNPLRYDVSKLSEDIKNTGIKEPLVLAYYQANKRAHLAEGNHRLAAAMKAGLTHVPARVVRIAHIEGRGSEVRGAEPDKTGYVRGDLKPSEIMDLDK